MASRVVRTFLVSFFPASVVFSEIELGAVDPEMGFLPYALALMAPFFFGLCTWRMEAHVQTHPGKALPLTASQLVVVAATSALWGVVSGGEGRGEALVSSMARRARSMGSPCFEDKCPKILASKGRAVHKNCISF